MNPTAPAPEILEDTPKKTGLGLKKPLAFFALGCLAVGSFRLARGRRGWMEWLAGHISTPWRDGVSGLLDALPFSGAEAVCLLAGLAAVWYLVRGRGRLAARLVWLAGAAVWVYLGVCLFWGAHYYTTSFAQRAGIELQSVETDHLRRTAQWFRDMANETAPTVKRDEHGRFDYTWQEIIAESEGLYAGAEEKYPFLTGPERAAKPALFSWPMSLTGFTGYIFPFTGESTLNVHCPEVFLPVTIAHEFSHQKGVAQEQEANFVGIEACITSGKAEWVYSGYLFGYLQLANALWKVDPDLWQELEAGLCPQAKADMAVNNEYWEKYKDEPVAKAAEATYEGFLYSYDQFLGMKSYGACVDLLVAEYRHKLFWEPLAPT